jgi:hypothetical protein
LVEAGVETKDLVVGPEVEETEAAVEEMAAEADLVEG